MAWVVRWCSRNVDDNVTPSVPAIPRITDGRRLFVTSTCNSTSFLLHQSPLSGDRATDAPRFETQSQRRSEHETVRKSAWRESRVHDGHRRWHSGGPGTGHDQNRHELADAGGHDP